MVQSNNSNLRKLNCKIEEFLEDSRDFINNMDDNTFNTNKQSMINNLFGKAIGEKSVYLDISFRQKGSHQNK